MDKPKYKRVLLKLSGEALAGDRGIGINNEVVNEIAVAIKKVREIGIEVAVVVGGGNFWRGRTSEGMEGIWGRNSSGNAAALSLYTKPNTFPE